MTCGPRHRHWVIGAKYQKSIWFGVQYDPSFHRSNRATFYARFEDKYALLDEVTEQAFHEMIPEQVANAQEFTDEICDQLILLTNQYNVDFYRICRKDSYSMATLVDEKIKKMPPQTLESIFLKGDTHHGADKHHIKDMAVMTGSAI